MLLSLLLLSLFNSVQLSFSNTLVFSAGPNSYVAFDSWRPCLNGYVRFDIRTNAHDGTLAYIDDRGKFDFFYLKLIEGKLRLLFNLGNDRQALNVNMNINDDQWHTILIKRDGQTTILSIDHGLASNSTVTYSEDLYFGGSTHQEYQASPFYFGGIPAALERPSSGNLSSFDVYMQPRFRGRLRNLIYKNCSNHRLVQPVHLQIAGGVSLIPNHHCSGHSCGPGLCLITDHGYQCLCDETDYYGDHCQYERQPNELTFNGKSYLNYQFPHPINSSSEFFEFQLKTMHYNGLLFQFLDHWMTIRLKQGQINLEYRWNDQIYEISSKDLDLIDNQWHHVQIKRKQGQITLMIDEYHLQFHHEFRFDQTFHFHQLNLAGNNHSNQVKFHGCFKEISLTFNENSIFNISQDFLQNHSRSLFHPHGMIDQLRCSALFSPIEFLISSSYLSMDLPESMQQMFHYQWNISFHFQTYSSDAILFYANSKSSDDFLGLDLIDGFFYLTLNRADYYQREELFPQRVNDGQTHFFHLYLQGYQGGLEFQITLDHRQNFRLPIRNFPSRIHFQTLTIGGINPNLRWLPKNFWSGIMHRGVIGCFSDLELNSESINLTRYINSTQMNIAPKPGPCTTLSSSKRECSCEHGGECRTHNGASWTCDCSKTGYTGRRCEHPTYHLDLMRISTLELNTNMQWSEQINDIAFGLKASVDQENFLQFRPCRLPSSSCDSISFSIRNGLLQINFTFSNQTNEINGEYPFLLDSHWHYIHLHRIDTKLLLHIDHHIAQQRFTLHSANQSMLATIWMVIQGTKEILIEDLRLYDQSINAKFFLHHPSDSIQLKHRPWKPLNAISFYDHQDAYITIQLNDILCQECELDSIYFDFRTTELTGLLFFANIQTNSPKKRSYAMDTTFDKEGQYLVLKLVDGQLHLIVLVASAHEDEDEIHQIQTQHRLNDGHWHHISLHRASDHHLELMIDTREYYLLTSIHFIDTIYFGRPSFLSSDLLPFNHIHTLKTCLASLTLNSRSINLREYISPHASIRNECFLNSQCPLRPCHNTGRCLDRMKCDCRHTSFQGDFCTDLKTGYLFNDHIPGLIFEQPYQPEKKFINYRLSFGLVTKMATAELIRISDQIQLELSRGFLRAKLAGNMQQEQESVQNEIIVNDGSYHLIQLEYNSTNHFRLAVDGKSTVKQLTYRLNLDQPLVLLIGQNPAFRQGFQGQLYGLESDLYSIFDLISPTFQRISYASMQEKSYQTLYSLPSSTSLLPPSLHPQDDLIPSVCSYQSYDDICLMTSDTQTSPLSYPNLTLLSALPSKNRTLLPSTIISSALSSSTRGITLISSTSTSSISSSQNERNSTASITSSSPSNTSLPVDLPPLIVSIRTPTTNSSRSKFHWSNLWVFLVPILCGTVLCLVLALLAFMKYRRKDVGVYEVEEAQRFRPLIVQLSPTTGEQHQHETIHSSPSPISSPSSAGSKKRRQKKTQRTPNTDEQREFYI